MSVSSSSLPRFERGRSSSPFAVVASAQFESGPPASKVKYSSDDGEIFETVQEEAWEERKKKTTTTTKNIEKRVQRKLFLEDGEVVGDTGPVITEDATEDTVTKEVKSDENQKPQGQLAAVTAPPGDGWMAVPGAVIISEKSTKVTNSHDEVEDERETEEIQHCGDVTNKEAQDHVVGRSDLRNLISHRESKGWELAKPKKRIVYEATRKRGNIDTEDVKENSKIEDGHVVTETERTVRQEQYDNESAPDSGSSLSDGSVHEATKETAHNLVHTKDEDILEYYAVPKGGTLAQGVKLGEGMHVVSEDVHEDKQGEDGDEQTNEKVRKIRKPSRRDALTRKPLDYNQEEQTRKCETNRWLENHFGSESGRSESSYDDGGSERKSSGGGNRITITMSPHPATPEATATNSSSPVRRWPPSSANASAAPVTSSLTPKAPPPPPPKPTRNWSSSRLINHHRDSPDPVIMTQSLNRRESPTRNWSSRHASHYPHRDSPEPVLMTHSLTRDTRRGDSPQHDSQYIQQSSELAEARARLRYTGKKLTEEEENKENSAPSLLSNSINNVKSSNRFQNSSRYSPPSASVKITSMKDNDAVYNSKFRSGKQQKREAPRGPSETEESNRSYYYNRSSNSSPPPHSMVIHHHHYPQTNVGRSQSFNMQTLPSPSKKKDTSSWHQKLKKSFRDFRSDEHLGDKKNIVYDSRTHNNIDTRPMSEQQNSWRSKKSYSPPRTSVTRGEPRKWSPTRGRIFSTLFGRETGTQTGHTPVAPPRTKKKKRPQSSYFFGQETAACIFPPKAEDRPSEELRPYSDNAYVKSRFSTAEDRTSVSPKPAARRVKTTKTVIPIVFTNDDNNRSKHHYEKEDISNHRYHDQVDNSNNYRRHNKEDYYSTVNKSSWTNTVDPRRKPRIINEDETRSKTLPKKPHRSKTLSNKTYIFGESDSPNDSGHENVYHRGSMQNISDYNNRFTSSSITDRLSSHRTSKPVGRSQSFNILAGSGGGGTRPSSYGRTLADLSGQRRTMTYGSSPYLNLRSPNLISTIARTSSTQRINENLHQHEPGTTNGNEEIGYEKRDRFMKGLLNTAPELFHFIHGEDDPKKPSQPITVTDVKQPSTYVPPSVKSPNSSYSAKVFTFGKSDNNTLTRTSSQGNDSGFSNSYNSMEENNKRNICYSSTLDSSNNKKNSLMNNNGNINVNNGNNRRSTTFNLKTSGSSLLYSPSFRSENEDRKRRSRTSSGENNRLSGEFSSGKGHISTNVREGSPVLIQVRDWNTR